MRKNLLAFTFVAGCFLFSMNVNGENTKTNDVVASETAQSSDTVDAENDGPIKAPTPLKVVGGGIGVKVKSNSLQAAQSVKVLIQDEELEAVGSNVSVVDIAGKIVGKGVLKGHETEITFNAKIGVYILSVIKDGERILNTKLIVNK